MRRCEEKCGPNMACRGGECVCLSSFGDCDGDAANGCETDLYLSAAHCGACGSVCDVPDASSTCSRGGCTFACSAGRADCDGDPSNGCETPSADCASCLPEADSAFCARLGKNCDSVTAPDNCGEVRTTFCGACGEGKVCGAELPNVCTPVCVAESDAALCAASGADCGALVATDSCGAVRAVTCGTCEAGDVCGGQAPNRCGPAHCQPEAEADLCRRLGKDCGTLQATDSCGNARSVSCGTCAPHLTCGARSANRCGVAACTAESDSAFCARHSADCGPLTAADNCGDLRTVSCGVCPSGQTCGAARRNACGVLSCVAELDSQFCARLEKDCGWVSGTDNCLQPRTAWCGTCSGGKTCGAVTANVCGVGCTPENTPQFCARLEKDCGWVSADDNCGNPRTLYCGACAPGQVCGAVTSNVCGISCIPQDDATFCAERLKNCGTVSGTDNCGQPRSVSCGTCGEGQSCGAVTPNVCGAVGSACATPVDLNEQPGFEWWGFTYSGSTTGKQNQSGSPCGGSSAPEVVMRLQVLQAGNLTLTTEGGTTAFDTVLYVRTECDVAGSLVACNDDGGVMNSSRLTLEGLEAGTVLYVFVDGFGSAHGQFTLTGELSPVCGVPDEELCAVWGAECGEATLWDWSCGDYRLADCGGCVEGYGCGLETANYCSPLRPPGAPCESYEQCAGEPYGQALCFDIPGGYCAIEGCGYCPEGSVCAYGYCFKACDSDDDCREGYECLDDPAGSFCWSF